MPTEPSPSYRTVYRQSLRGLFSISLQAHTGVLHRERRSWATPMAKVVPFMHRCRRPPKRVGPSTAVPPEKSYY